MTEAQRDDLIEELSIYSPSQVRQMVADYQQSQFVHDHQLVSCMIPLK